MAIDGTGANPKKPTVYSPTPRSTYTPPPGPGLGISDVTAFHQETAALISQIPAQFTSGGASTAAQRSSINDRLKYGLAGIGLQREGLGLDREQQEINSRNAIESAINNALQRGIYRSGIRVRNVQRAEEQAGIDEGRLDLRGRQIDLSEEELRSSIKNALAALNANASAQRAARQAAIEAAQNDLRTSREIALIEWINAHGGVIRDDVVRPYIPGLERGRPR